MSRALGLLLAVLLLAGCTAGPTGGSSRGTGAGATSGGGAGNVDVDTPALRRLKARAGVEPCRPGSASNRMPDVTLACLGGGTRVDLTRLRGPMVINLFAQWCGPCRSELPYYQRLHREGRGVVDVLGVDYLDTQPEAALALVRQTGVTYPLLADPHARLRGPFRVRGLPGIILLKADGSVSVQYRSIRSYPELRQLVQQELAVRLPA